MQFQSIVLYFEKERETGIYIVHNNIVVAPTNYLPNSSNGWSLSKITFDPGGNASAP